MINNFYMLPELKTIFEQVDSEILNEDTLKQISILVEQTVDKKVSDRLVLETEEKLKLMDEDHAAKLQQYHEDIDRDHTAKVKMVVESINADHTEKFNKITSLYENQLKKVANQHRTQLVESINDYLDAYLEKAIPTATIMESVKNKHLSKIVEEAKEILGIDEKYVKQNVRTAILEGKKQMDTLAEENRQLKNQQLISESRRLIAEKTANLPADKAKFVRAKFSNRTPEFIKENFQYVVEMYERKQDNSKRSVLNENKNFVDRKRVADEIIKESSENVNSNTSQSESPSMDMYLESMKFRK